MILLTGANGVVGFPLCERLRHQQRAFINVSRQASSDDNAVQWDLNLPLNAATTNKLKKMTPRTLIHCAPIWLLPANLTAFADCGVKRIIAFSSTSVLSKKDSTNPQEQLLVNQLAKAEQALFNFAEQRGVAVTILRPSLIYGYGRDQNISHIAGFIKRYGVMFLVGKAQGKRQPVHADDLVGAVFAVENNPRTHNKAYNVAGGEVITYRHMVERIFRALGKTPRIIRLPLAPFRLLLRLGALLRRFSYTPEMADRMSQHLAYDNREAQDDFAYKPQVFLSFPERDLLVSKHNSGAQV